MIARLFEALIFFLPAGIANMTPIFANKVPVLNRWETPVDFHKSFRGKRIFGDHKTWRGIVTGTVCGTLLGWPLLALLGPSDDIYFILLAPLAMSFGALAGDAIKSFFKRQVGVASGKSWFPFDQTDYIIGGLLLVLPFHAVSLSLAGIIFVEYFALHLISTYIGFKLGLKDSAI